MGTIQSGQVLQQVNMPSSTSQIQQGSIQKGRVLRGMNSYDEKIRQGIISKVSDINKLNSENKQLQEKYYSILSQVNNMDYLQYRKYYASIPSNLKEYFIKPEDIVLGAEMKAFISSLSTAEDRASQLSKLIDDETYNIQDQLKQGNSSGAHDAMTRRANYQDEYDKLDTYIHQVQIPESSWYGGDPNALASQELQEQRWANTRAESYTNYMQQQQQTIKQTKLNQNVISLPLSQAKQLEEESKVSYVNQFGQPISYQKQFYLNPPKEQKQSNLFSSSFGKTNNPLEQAIFKTNMKNEYTPKFKLNTNIIDIPVLNQRGTIGTPTKKILPFFTSKTIGEQSVEAFEGVFKELGSGFTQGSQDLFKSVGLPLTEDIKYSSPQNIRGTSNLNPSTLKFEVPTKTTTINTVFSDFPKVVGMAPELLAWTYAAPVIATPYIIRGTEVALNKDLTSSQRLGGVLEGGVALAFSGYAGKIAKVLPKTTSKLKEFLPYSSTYIETTKLKVPKQEGVLGVPQVNPVEVYTDIYGKQITKYGYNVKSIIPEVAESTGQVTRVYKQNTIRDLLGLQPKLVYSGGPYTDKLAYNKAIKELTNTGLTEAQAKAKIRLTAPKYAESKVSGEAFALFGEESIPKTFLKAEQTITPKIIEVGGIKTRSFEPEKYFIKSRGVEAGTKGDVMLFKSLPEYTKTYMKDGAVYSKLKQAGKTTEVFEQLTGIKSLGTRELKSTVSDIGYARTYVPKELEAFKDVSVSRKVIPNERKLTYGKSNILTSNIEEPIIIFHDAPFKVTKEIKTGSVTGTTLKKGEQTAQQKYVQLFDTSTKELNLVKEAKSNLVKEQQRISNQLIKAQTPQVPIIKNPNKEFITLYHGTSESGAKSILEKGLVKKQGYNEVYLTTDKAFAEGFAGRTVSKGGFKEKPIVLKVNIPKSEYERLLVKREIGKGGIDEVTLKNVPSKYIINPFEQIPKSSKLKEIIGTSKTIGTNMFEDLTGQGKIEGLGTTGNIGSLGTLEGRFGRTVLEPKLKDETKIIDVFKIRDDYDHLNKVKLPQKEDTSTTFKQPSKLNYKQPQLFKTEQQYKQTTDFKPRPDIFTDVGKPITPTEEKTKPKLPLKFKERSKPTKRQAEVLSKAFTVLIRSKGKVTEIGKGLPYGKALKLGVEKSKSSLAQTFALRESGTTRLSDINYRVPENLFGKPKGRKTYITAETWTEKRGKTLTNYPEIKGLQTEKKIKQRNLKWF